MFILKQNWFDALESCVGSFSKILNEGYWISA